MAWLLDAIDKRVWGELRLSGIDLRLEPGQVNVLLGPARVGKTVLLDGPLANLDTKLREQLREDLHLAFGECDAVLLWDTAVLWRGIMAAIGRWA